MKTEQQVIDYLKKHRVMTLATVTQGGAPMAHTVEYASDGETIYFITNGTTRKAGNIRLNPRVALTVDEDYDDWSTIKGVQLEAEAVVLTDQAEIEKAAAVYIAKFPFVANFPPNPQLAFVRVTPLKGFFLDYTKGFTHKDPVNFSR